MTPIQFVGLAVRLYAIWLLTWVLRNVPAQFVFRVTDMPTPVLVFIIVYSALMLLIAAFLWMFPLAVSSKLIPSSTSSHDVPLSMEQAHSVGASLLGMWILSKTVPDLAFATIALSARTAPIDTSAYASVVRLLVEFAIGLWLVLGARGFLGLMRFLRNAGRT